MSFVLPALNLGLAIYSLFSNMLKSVSCLLILAISTQASRLSDGRSHANIAPIPAVPIIAHDSSKPIISSNGTELPPLNTTYHFDQLIDHNNPSLGTFKQRFWHTAQYYETGGPIILMTPGEANAERKSWLPMKHSFILYLELSIHLCGW